MAQNITLLGASYSDVPSVELPKTGGGTAQFDDTTIASNAASASDITSGKLAFVNGELVTGTASGGGATLITKSITANGTYNASSDNADGYSSVTVNVSGGGGGGGNMSDPIRFFDYDGTLVASYTAVPASLPSVPTHTGLTNGTWNYTLQEVTTQFNAMGTCDVGANYETSSGKTEIDCEFVAGRLSPYLRFAVKGTVTVDWGDGSATETMTGTSLTTRKDMPHTYAAPGSYTITIAPDTGTTYAMYGTSTYTLLHNNSSTANANRVYSNCVKKVRVGSGCTIGDYAFSYCFSLLSVSIRSGITSLGSSSLNYCYSLSWFNIPSGVTRFTANDFGYCYSLKGVSTPLSVTNFYGNAPFTNCTSLEYISIPSGITSISSSAFMSCYSLRKAVFGNGLTTINGTAFSACYSLTSLSFGSSLSSIAAQAFNNCYGVIEYHFKSTTVPTLANTNAFANIQSNCKIYVPAASLTAYQTANNWSTYASYMVGE